MRAFCFILLLVPWSVMPLVASAQVLDKQQQLASHSFWDNRDWDWYAAQIPFFECPDEDITTTYYYRWELLTKHLTYGSPNSGYTFTEFIDRPFWSGAYGAISCPAGHQLYEARWLREPTIAQDYLRYWFETPGAQPRNYSTWLADSAWAVHQVHRERSLLRELLPDLVENYGAWERRHYVPEVGLFWQTGHDDGMEYNINSRQTEDIIRGAPAFRPTINSYMWADAVAIANIAAVLGEDEIAQSFTAKARQLKENLQAKLWDKNREFFFPMSRDRETRDGETVEAGTLTYQSGKYAGSPHGRELIGYVPWQFGLPDAGKGFERAWRFLMDEHYFFAPFGPTTVEQNDPQFVLKNSCCWWSGQSWPYATTQTLKAMANLLQDYDQHVVSKEDYLKLLEIYARSHRKDGKPYLAEALNPYTGSFEGHDSYNHSEHYFHSGYCDLVITGLVGLKPRADDLLEIEPLAPADWDYFALDDVVYHGRRVSILWDRHGDRYDRGAGLQIVVDGEVLVRSDNLQRIAVPLPARPVAPKPSDRSSKRVNFAVNNDGLYFPRTTASYTAPGTSAAKLVDGNYWYHVDPPNRWTAVGSPNEQDWIDIDFGTPRPIDTIKLYFLDDGEGVVAPEKYHLRSWDGDRWIDLPVVSGEPANPTGHRANAVRIDGAAVSRLRLVLEHAAGGRSGLTEIEAWGDATLPIEPAAPPAGNLAFNDGDKAVPKATASHTSRFDRLEAVNDGRVVYSRTPANRWTAYESKSPTDWLEIDLGESHKVARVDLHIYDDRGGVQAPKSYTVQYLDGQTWRPVANPRKTPEHPTGGTVNTVEFDPVRTEKLRVVFVHRGDARSGLTEIEIWEE